MGLSDLCKYTHTKVKQEDRQEGTWADSLMGGVVILSVSNHQIISLVCQECWWGIVTPGFEQWNHGNGGYSVGDEEEQIYKCWIRLGLGGRESQIKAVESRRICQLPVSKQNTPLYSADIRREAGTDSWVGLKHIRKPKQLFIHLHLFFLLFITNAAMNDST